MTYWLIITNEDTFFSRFSGNSEAFPSLFQEHNEEMFSRPFIQNVLPVPKTHVHLVGPISPMFNTLNARRTFCVQSAFMMS